MELDLALTIAALWRWQFQFRGLNGFFPLLFYIWAFNIFTRKQLHQSQIIPLPNSHLKIHKFLSIERRPSLAVDIFSDFFPLFNSKSFAGVWMKMCLWLWLLCLYRLRRKYKRAWMLQAYTNTYSFPYFHPLVFIFGYYSLFWKVIW